MLKYKVDCPPLPNGLSFWVHLEGKQQVVASHASQDGLLSSIYYSLQAKSRTCTLWGLASPNLLPWCKSCCTDEKKHHKQICCCKFHSLKIPKSTDSFTVLCFDTLLGTSAKLANFRKLFEIIH